MLICKLLTKVFFLFNLIASRYRFPTLFCCTCTPGSHQRPSFRFLLPVQPVCGQPLARRAHYPHLRILFPWLQHFGLVINLETCWFHVNKIEFQGHSVSAGAGMQQFPQPATVKDMQVLMAWPEENI